MKTLAVRLDDEVMDLLAIVAQLEGTSMVDQIRTAINDHLVKKAAGGDLAEKAQAALDDIDREASARKDAIGTLLGKPSKSTGTPAKGRSRRGQAAEPGALFSEVRTMGFAPSRSRLIGDAQ